MFIHEYSQRSLTFEKDKFYAIAGLVKQVDAALDDQYLAGIWRSTLPTSLCWMRDYRELYVDQNYCKASCTFLVVGIIERRHRNRCRIIECRY
jgi:hypothetical protein